MSIPSASRSSRGSVRAAWRPPIRARSSAVDGSRRDARAPPTGTGRAGPGRGGPARLPARAGSAASACPPHCARRLMPPCAFTTRCHGRPSGQCRIAWPTARAARGHPSRAATCPYVATRPRGIRAHQAVDRARGNAFTRRGAQRRARQLVQPRVEPAPAQQLRVRALPPGSRAAMQHQDAVRLLDGREPVRDGRRWCVPPASRAIAVPDQRFGLRIDAGGRLVQHEDAGLYMSARAMASSWRWPCERLAPRSRSVSPRPPGSAVQKRSALAASTARAIAGRSPRRRRPSARFGLDGAA